MGSPRITITPKTCTVVLAADPPEPGYAAQFRRVNADGTFTNIGTKDSTGPFTRTTTLSAGSNSYQVVWTKTGTPAIVQLIACPWPSPVVAAAPDPAPVPVPVPVPTPAPVQTPEPAPEQPPAPTPAPTPTPTLTPTPSPAPAGTKRVLGPADFTYLGAMRVPSFGVDLVFSQGALTGRKVNGQVRLLMAGSRTAGDPIYEFADTGSYHADPLQAPRMPLVKDWGKIYGSARKSWDQTGAVRDLSAGDYLGQLHFNEATQLLYWTYYDSYNVAHYMDWCLGATQLGVGSFGPWRFAGGGRQGPWRGIQIAQHPVTGQILCGSRLLSGNSISPWGPDLWGGVFPTASTPSGFGAPDLPVQKYLTYYPIIGQVDASGRTAGAIVSCRRPGDYFFEPINGQNSYNQVDPAKNGGVGSWTELDAINGHVWIDLPDAHGVIFTGKLASAHVWYSNAGVGNLLCTHGMPSPVAITGPVSTDAYPVMMVYDPADLNAVRAGAKVDHTVNPVHVIDVEATFGITTARITEVGTAKSIGGAYFDPSTRKLYVAAPQADLSTGLLNPLVHVFQVN
jgi:hypothetical protein